MAGARTGPDKVHVLLAGEPSGRIRRAFAGQGHRTDLAALDSAIDAVHEGIEAVIIFATRAASLALTRRLKTRFQVPLLPVVAMVTRPPGLAGERVVPDAWLSRRTRPPHVVARVEELVRIRRAERELVRLNAALAELAAENGRLYDRARRDAEATATLLRELQHRVRNNLAAIQALLILERHRRPPRPLAEAIDVAITRLRSMAALQDTLLPNEARVQLASLADAVTRGAMEVFGASGAVLHRIRGDATLPARAANAVAIVLNELVTNALKHADAREICLELRIADGGEVELVVADDGCGMRTEAEGGSGLMIVRAVVRNELAGELTFLPAERGTRVRVSIPPG